MKRVRWRGRVVLCLGLGLAVFDTAVGAEALSNGGVVAGAISASGEMDSYTFSASAGENIMLRVADLSASTAFFPSITLYNPTGGFVLAGSGQNVGRLDVLAGATGTYTVVVADGSTFHSAVGSYDLHFVRAPGANADGPLHNGGVDAGVVELGDIDSYTFSVNAGENILLRVADLSGTSAFFPFMTLFNPSGGYVTAGAGANVGRIEVPAGATGTYTVVVSDGSTTGDAVGSYNLYLARVPGADEGGRLYDGPTRFDAIDLGDLDSYTFAASAGQNAQVVVTDTSGGTLFPAVSLYGPTGASITFSSGPTTVTLTRTILTTGVYTLVVDDATTNGDATGTYSIRLTGAGGAPPVNALAPSALVLLATLLGALAVRQQRQRG